MLRLELSTPVTKSRCFDRTTLNFLVNFILREKIYPFGLIGTPVCSYGLAELPKGSLCAPRNSSKIG